jgi:predicted amino acid racemase
VQKAVKFFEKNGIELELVDTPSATCTTTLERMKEDGSNCAEPGHGLTGTTPTGTVNSMSEKISVVYVSEVSHNFKDKAYCFGGGYYRRSHVQNALCGKNLLEAKKLTVGTPDLDSIDYHFELSEEATVGDTVVMAFRFQIFVTRSDVVLVKGISEGKPEIIGVFDSVGNEK